MWKIVSLYGGIEREMGKFSLIRVLELVAVCMELAKWAIEYYIGINVWATDESVVLEGEIGQNSLEFPKDYRLLRCLKLCV